NAYRLIHGASDGWPGWYVDRLGDFLLSQSEHELAKDQLAYLRRVECRGAYHKLISRQAREDSPSHVFGEAAPEFFSIRENGVQFELSFQQGYSTGLFLDQRDNRRRLLTHYVAPEFILPARALVLNTFAYT